MSTLRTFGSADELLGQVINAGRPDRATDKGQAWGRLLAVEEKPGEQVEAGLQVWIIYGNEVDV